MCWKRLRCTCKDGRGKTASSLEGIVFSTVRRGKLRHLCFHAALEPKSCFQVVCPGMIGSLSSPKKCSSFAGTSHKQSEDWRWSILASLALHKLLAMCFFRAMQSFSSRLGAPRQHITGKLLLKTIARR